MKSARVVLDGRRAAAWPEDRSRFVLESRDGERNNVYVTIAAHPGDRE